MPNGESYARIRRTGAQFVRFSLVGASNTAVDIAVTNALVLLLKPGSGFLLMLISVVACGIATLNSYALNRRWTFRTATGEVPKGAVGTFFAIALLSMVVNTSTFLFVARYLPESLPLHPLATINVAKLAGVAAAFTVSFLGYRFGVFQTDAIHRFRASFRFPLLSTGSVLIQLAAVLVLAAAVRGAYLLLTTAVYGDAVSYALVADSLVRHDAGQVDAFWSSLFVYWEALLRLCGFAPLPSAILASFIPGTLLIIPVVWIARTLYGSAAAWVAGVLCAVHPRLVEYSCNGNPESLSILAFATAIALLTGVLQGERARTALAAGAAFGVFTCVRNEGLLLFLLALALLPGVAAWRGRRGAAQGPVRPARWHLVAASVAGFALVTGGFIFLSVTALNTPGLFRRSPTLESDFSGQLDMRDAARERYGRDGVLYGPPRPAQSIAYHARVLAARVPRNVMYVLERLPGILVSPIPLFALLLPIFAGFTGRPEGPLLLMLLFPLGFYSLVNIEPRLFYPILIPIHVFGAAGLVAFSEYVRRELDIHKALVVCAASLAALSVLLAAWRGFDASRNYDFHQPLAAWIRLHVPPEDAIMGCGYGYVSTTGFLAGRRTLPRLWTENAGDLAAFADQKGVRWMVIYEKFLRVGNPELLPALASGVPGFRKCYETSDRRGNRAQVHQRVTGKPEVERDLHRTPY